MRLKNKRIFMVEDNPAYVTIASIYLRNEGAEVESDQWGQDIIQVISRHLPVDVILLDLMLRKNINGFDVFDQIRRMPELATVPVIAVSAVDPEEALPRARAKGFAGFIGKPISPTIVADVAAVLDGKPVWKSNGWHYWAKI